MAGYSASLDGLPDRHTDWGIIHPSSFVTMPYESCRYRLLLPMNIDIEPNPLVFSPFIMAMCS